MDWTNKSVENRGRRAEVMVLDVDEERRRISLGIKQCQPAHGKTARPQQRRQGHRSYQVDHGLWHLHRPGWWHRRSHLSDISWNETGEDAIRNYKKGDELETMVLAVDAERERISLGVWQLDADPFLTANPRGTVNGTILEVDAKGATVELADGVEGYIRSSEPLATVWMMREC